MGMGLLYLRKENIFPLLIIFLFCLIVPFPALTHSGEDHEGLTWPPQPRGITNVVDHSDVHPRIPSLAVQSSLIDQLEQKAKLDSRVNRALGNKFTRITLIDKENENGKVVKKMIFFSRDKNATVEVKFVDEKIQAVKSIPAGEYQPEISDEEANEAKELARTYFLNKGVAKIADLKAYSILAYKPEGHGFFDTRVIYVSFHKDDDSPPELMAWVDLTNQRIIKEREEQ